MDPIERSLQEIADKLLVAWRGQNCLACPLAELAALANATLIFYQEQRKLGQWSEYWRQEEGGGD